MQVITTKHKINMKVPQKQLKIQGNIKVHKKAMAIAIAILSISIALVYTPGSISLPNVSMGSIFDPLPIYKSGLGAVNGYVIGSPQVPILGTIMVAAEQSGQFQTISTGIEPDGKYVFQDLKPGKYMMIAFFPNGEYRVINNIPVEPNSVQTLYFKY
jgi:hypothetical protein